MTTTTTTTEDKLGHGAPTQAHQEPPKEPTAPMSSAPPAAYPTERELRALRLFVSQDETRPFLNTLWHYASDVGATYVATNGHIMTVRRSGTHRTMMPLDIFAMGPDKSVHKGDVQPPNWAALLHPPKQGKLAPVYGISPGYFAMLADVERAAGARDAEDYVPRPHMTKKDERKERENVKRYALAVLVLPSDPLDGWFWKIEAKAALWNGIIMPRRT
jgi:hypothetical protein